MEFAVIPGVLHPSASVAVHAHNDETEHGSSPAATVQQSRSGCLLKLAVSATFHGSATPGFEHEERKARALKKPNHTCLHPIPKALLKIPDAACSSVQPRVDGFPGLQGLS